MNLLSDAIIREEDIADPGRIKRYVIEPFKEGRAYAADAAAQEPPQGLPQASVPVIDEEAVAAARAQGFEDGAAKGRQDAREELKEAFGLASKIAESLRAEQSDIIKSAEEALVKLSVAIARQVIRQEVKADPAIVKNICKAAVDQLVEKEGLAIRVNPGDMRVIQEYAQTLGKGAGLQKRIEVFSDELIKPGGCIVEAESGSIDADIDSQLEEIAGHLYRKEE